MSQEQTDFLNQLLDELNSFYSAMPCGEQLSVSQYDEKVQISFTRGKVTHEAIYHRDGTFIQNFCSQDSPHGSEFHIMCEPHDTLFAEAQKLGLIAEDTVVAE